MQKAIETDRVVVVVPDFIRICIYSKYSSTASQITSVDYFPSFDSFEKTEDEILKTGNKSLKEICKELTLFRSKFFF